MTDSTTPSDSAPHASSFTVVSMMREDPAIIRRFIDFYRQAGAMEIAIFHDGPLAAMAELDGPGVTITECDAAFWQSLCGGPRPEVHEEAQAAIYNAAWKTCLSDWLLVVDADEFVTGPKPIQTLLAAIPPGIDAIRLPTAEAVWGPGDDLAEEFGSTHFRLPLRRGSRLVQRLVYGDLADLFQMGLLGHYAGKHFVRRDARIDRVLLHNSLRDGRPVARWATDVAPQGEGFVVAHFDAVGFERWREKWRRRLTGEITARDLSPRRRAQMLVIGNGLTQGDVTARGLFARLNSLTAWQCFLLRLVGGMANFRIPRQICSAP